jgi:two-component system repressor protein LuxO
MDIISTFTALLVEDSISLGLLYTDYLRADGAKVTHVSREADALNELKQWQPDLLVLNIKLPGISGMDILELVHKQYPDITVIIIAAQETIDLAIDVMRSGAFHFIVKPFEPKRLSITVRHALQQSQLVNLVAKYESSFSKSQYMDFIGESLVMQTIYKTIDSVASSKASVFIVGESGTGKEICANAIHHAGSRSGEAFIALNCASIPKDLIESEIFGHIKGAFTGAIANRDGAATSANNGTLFLDEICEMDLGLQSKLLRFIQTGVFQRVGATNEEKVNVRFISATNRIPLDEVNAGRFREDLFYRLHVIPIELPPLRVRGRDILLLANKFLKEYSKEEGKQFKGFSADTKQYLKNYQWPGNVRELQNVIRQVVVLNDSETVELVMLPIEITIDNNIKHITPLLQTTLLTTATLADVNTHSIDKGAVEVEGNFTEQVTLPASGVDIVPLWITEKQIIEDAIAFCGGNIPKAAVLLDISASTIYRKRQVWQ